MYPKFSSIVNDSSYHLDNVFIFSFLLLSSHCFYIIFSSFYLLLSFLSCYLFAEFYIFLFLEKPGFFLFHSSKALVLQSATFSSHHIVSTFFLLPWLHFSFCQDSLSYFIFPHSFKFLYVLELSNNYSHPLIVY